MSNQTIKVVQDSGPWGLVLVVGLAVLKTMGYIDWSWWWVFGPIWIPVAIVFGVLGLIFTIAAVASLFD